MEGPSIGFLSLSQAFHEVSLYSYNLCPIFSTASLMIVKDRAWLEASHATELMFLPESVPALKKYNAVIEKPNHEMGNRNT
jgi:hypothetical protein